MRHKFSGFLLLTLVLCIVAPRLGQAITISAPQTIEIGRPVTITVQGTLSGFPSTGCNVQLDFGDSTQPELSPECTQPSLPCGFTTTHIYQRPGTYTLRASGSGTCVGGFTGVDPAIKTIVVVDLNIQRVDLYFNNRQPKTTVNQYQRDLKAFAAIRYTGSGLLQGQWEIDGRLFSKVKKQLYRGQQNIIIQTPVAPPLPTHAMGSHQVRFVITRPAGALETPQAVYFVTADPQKFKPSIRLVAPNNNRTLVCEPTTFRWEALSKVYVYLVEFTEAGGSDPTFSAYAKKSEYTLRDDICRSLFSAGRSYQWQVKGLSQEGQIIGQSEAFSVYLNR